MAPGLNPMQGSKAQGFLGMGQSDTKRSFCIYIYICYPHQDLPFGRLRLARHSEQQMVAGFLGEADDAFQKEGGMHGLFSKQVEVERM